MCPRGPHFAAVNKNNEIIVTDFHNHSVKVAGFASSMISDLVFLPLSSVIDIRLKIQDLCPEVSKRIGFSYSPSLSDIVPVCS